ncbi:MAG: hypothetical protein JNL83_08125 [Myxococcales bacterium]|nr:hypothetical protein [Myxococcales bacterium]
MGTTELYERYMLPPTFALVVAGAVLLVLAGGVLACLLRTRRRIRLARAAEASVVDDPPPLLVEGADVVLAGLVRHFEDNDVAVKVSIRQSGSESESSGSWSHSWTEIDRDIVVRPFLLELSSGQLVLVHPPKNVDVADALDQKVWINRNERVLSAELVPGERIFARGRLERSDQAVPGGAYRDVAWGWALGPSDGQMLLSSEPLGAGLRQRAAFHRRFAIWGVALLVVAQVTLAGYYGRLFGHTATATITKRFFYQTTDSDGDTHDHWAVTVRGDDIEVAEDDHDRVIPPEVVPIRVSSPSNWALGSSATFSLWRLFALLAFVLVFWIPYRARRRSSRPWFRRKVNESLGGRLPDPPPRAKP